MMRLFILCLLEILFCTPYIFAGNDSYKSVVIEKSDLSSLIITMESGMASEISNGEFVISGKCGSFVLPASDVRKFSFSKDQGQPIDKLVNSIGDAYRDNPVIIRYDNVLTIGNLPEGMQARLIDIAGREVRSAVSSGDCMINIQGLAPGIYVLSYGNESIKFVLR